MSRINGVATEWETWSFYALCVPRMGIADDNSRYFVKITRNVHLLFFLGKYSREKEVLLSQKVGDCD